MRKFFSCISIFIIAISCTKTETNYLDEEVIIRDTTIFRDTTWVEKSIEELYSKMNDWEKQNLKGKVKSMEIRNYSLGIIENNLIRFTSFPSQIAENTYDEKGYILISKVSIPTPEISYHTNKDGLRVMVIEDLKYEMNDSSKVIERDPLNRITKREGINRNQRIYLLRKYGKSNFLNFSNQYTIKDSILLDDTYLDNSMPLMEEDVQYFKEEYNYDDEKRICHVYTSKSSDGKTYSIHSRTEYKLNKYLKIDNNESNTEYIVETKSTKDDLDREKIVKRDNVGNIILTYQVSYSPFGFYPVVYFYSNYTYTYYK